MDYVSEVNIADALLPPGTYLPFDGNDIFYVYDYFLFSQRTNNIKVNDHEVSAYYPGKLVFNNPECINDQSMGYYQTKIVSFKESLYLRNDRILGRIRFKDGFPFLECLSVGDKVYKGDILVGQYPVSLENEDGFLRVKDYNGTNTIFFTKADSDGFVDFRSAHTAPLKGFYSSSAKILNGTKAPAGKHCVRPYFDFDSSKVAYLKAATSNSAPSISTTFSETPASVAYSGDDKKLVIKSDGVSISSNISNDKLTSDRQDSEVEFRDNTIYVPYDSKSLTLKSGAFNTNNASHITALINQAGVKKYAVLGDSTSDLNIDLNNILDTKTPGSKITISFYAEKINAEHVSDEISITPVTINLEVAQGNEQTITYNLDGGSGSVPQNATIRTGKQFQLADGSSFSKEVNKFSAWQMSYTPYGETEAKTRIVNSNETIVVPDAQDQTITMTALYGGIKASKTTETKTSFTVTWNTNAPDGYQASFDGSESGDFNSDRSKKFDKVKLQNSTVGVPGKPKLNKDDYFFVGWYETTDQKNEVSGSVNVTQDKTYYGIWAQCTFFVRNINGIYGNPAKSRVVRYDMTWLQGKIDFFKTADQALLDWDNDYNLFKNSGVGNAGIYSLLKDSNGSWMNPDNIESWVEFRMIHFGDHDGDGSMMTFQMTHSVRDTNCRFTGSEVSNKNINWKDSLLRESVNKEGSLYRRFDVRLTSAIFEVEKKYNYAGESSVLTTNDLFFPLSYTELLANVEGEFCSKDSFGTTYDFWKDKTITNNNIRGESNSYVDSLRKARQGGDLGDPVRTFLRNAAIPASDGVLGTYKGYVLTKNSVYLDGAELSMYGYPCLAFAMGYKG